MGTALRVKQPVAVEREKANGEASVISLSQTMQSHPEQHWRQLSLTFQGRPGFDL